MIHIDKKDKLLNVNISRSQSIGGFLTLYLFCSIFLSFAHSGDGEQQRWIELLFLLAALFEKKRKIIDTGMPSLIRADLTIIK